MEKFSSFEQLCQELQKRDYSEKLRQSNFFDDVYGVLFLSDAAVAQQFLRDIFEDDTIVIEEQPQYRQEHLVPGSRSIITDVEIVDTNRNHYNVEIQKDRRGMESIRLRYYGSVFDAETIRPGQAVTDLPDLSQIMVTEIDFWGLNVPKIIFRMCAPEYGLELKNYGLQIIYVNGSYQADDRIGRMLEDLRQRDPARIKNREFARRSFELKRSKGEAEMVREQYIDLVNELAPEIREFGLEEGREEGEKIGEQKGIWKTAVRMAENGCSAEMICVSTDLSLEEVRTIIDKVRIRKSRSAV